MPLSSREQGLSGYYEGDIVYISWDGKAIENKGVS